MTPHISPSELEAKVRSLIEQPVSSLQCYADFHFGEEVESEVVKFPIETSDQNVFEASFCRGYNEEKYLAALSLQIGCATGCAFCGLAELGYKRNLSSVEIVEQLAIVLGKAQKRGYPLFSKPIKATFVQGGEPLANPYFPEAVEVLSSRAPLQLKVSSILPANNGARSVYERLVKTAAEYPNVIQFQVSLNSTDEIYRQGLTKIPLANFQEVRRIGELWKERVPDPRLVDLTFTITKDTPMNPEKIRKALPSDLFAIRLREWVPNQRGRDYTLEPVPDGYHEELARRFEDAGYRIIPGSPGEMEWMFKLEPGDTTLLKWYKGIRQAVK